MNRKRVREDILANLDKLPPKFSSAEYYNQQTRCYCLYGWLCVVTGGPDPKDYTLGRYRPVNEYLQYRYSADDGYYLYEVDRIARAVGTYDRLAMVSVIPARQLVDAVLNTVLQDD